MGENSYLVPFFVTDTSEQSTNERGLTSMPVGGVWGNDPWRSSAIMQTLPAMIGFEELKRNNFDEVKNEYHDRIFKLIGFDIEADIDSWKENSDGFYMKYNILSNDDQLKPIGMIQYYYDKKNNRFSYRQSVMLTYLMDIGELKDFSADTFIINLEFRDIPVRNLNQVRGFEFGQLNGSVIERNAFVDYIRLKDLRTIIEEGKQPYQEQGIRFSRIYISGSSDKNLFQSFMHPDIAMATEKYDKKEIYEIINSLEGSNGNNKIDTIEESKAADLEFIYQILPYFYENAEKIISADSKSANFTPFSSHEEFLNSGFLEFGDDVADNKAKDPLQGFSFYANPVIFSWSEKASASAQTTDHESGLGSGTSFFYVNSKEKLAETDFSNFYPSLNDMEGEEIAKELIKCHLRACGITNDNYIENFTYVEMQRPIGCIWPNEITTEDPASFKENLKQFPVEQI